MKKGNRRSMKFALAVFLMSLAEATGAVAGTWETGMIDDSGDVGSYCELVRDESGNMHAVYLRGDTHELMAVSSIGTVWQLPEKVDSTGTAGGHCAIAVTGAAQRRFSFYRSGTKTLIYAGPESSPEWQTGPVTSSSDDIGRYCGALYHGDGSISVTCRNTTGQALVLVEGDTSCAWAPEQTIDPGPSRGAHCDHVYTPYTGYVFSENDGAHGSLVYVDSVLVPSEWETGPVTSSGDDIGRYCGALYHGDGTISVSCRNTDAQSLVLVEGNTSGVWAPEQTIDPGPSRGSHSDHVYTPYTGYAFSEYDGAHGSLLYVDSVLVPFQWDVGIVSDRFESGRFVSSCLAPDGRVASAFYFYEESTLGGIHISGTNEWGYSVVKGVVDSIGGGGLSNVYIDLAVTPEWDWHISYRNTLDGFLYYAFADSTIITSTEEEDGEDPIPAPSAFKLYQNAPNPFNPLTTIIFDLPRAEDVELTIYDVKGQRVATLVDRRMAAGRKTIVWDGKNGRGRAAASGIYFYRLAAGDFIGTRKMVLLR